MKKIIFILTLILSITSFADFPNITAKNLSLDFRKNNGVGYVNFLKYDINLMTFTHTALQAQIKKYPERIVINDTENQMEIHSSLDFLNNFSSLDLDDLNLLSMKKSFNLDMSHAVLEIDKENYDVNKFLFKCLGNDRTDEPDTNMDQVFSHCANQTNFTIEKLTFSPTSSLGKFFSNLVGDVELEKKNPIKIDSIHNLDININKNILNALVKIKFIFEIPLSVDGVVHFDKEKSQFKIEVKKAKIAFIDMRKFLFKELANFKIKEMKLDPPFIYITVASKK